MAMPSHVTYLIIGAGIHGLSTAWHLAEKLEPESAELSISHFTIA